MIDLPALPVAANEHAYPITRNGRPVRVCFLIDNLSRAGTETQLLALLRAFDRTRVVPSLVLLDGEFEASRVLEPSHCPVLRLGVKSLLSRRAVSAAREFARFLRRHDTDVLQVYFLDSLYFGAPVAAWAGVSHVIRVRNNLGYWLTRRHRILNRITGAFVDLTLTNSEEGRAALVADGLSPRHIAVLENGVDVERFSPVPPRFSDIVVIGAVANLRPVKGLDLLIAAAAELLRRRPTLRFEIAGDGPQRTALQAQIDAAGIGSRVTLRGAVTDVPAFLASTDIAVLPSRSEGMSNAVLEYMAAGRPIVATRVGANSRLIRDDVDGVLVDPEDAKALAQAIDRLIANPGLAKQLSAAAEQTNQAPAWEVVTPASAARPVTDPPPLDPGRGRGGPAI